MIRHVARSIGLFASLTVAMFAQPPAALKQSFTKPPDDARIMMRWWWFGPAVTATGLEREMRTMKASGIGGFEIQPTYPLALDDNSKGLRNLPFLGPEFLEALRFTARKSRELGLRMDLTLGSGWPYGGPSVPVNQAAGRLRIDRVKVSDSLRVPLPDLSNGETFLAAFAANSRQQLTDIRDGALWAPVGVAEVHFYIEGRTGMMVKRPSLGAEGYVMDHYDPAALTNYLNTTAEPMLRALGPLRPYALFCDSLEVFGSDWTTSFLDQFQKRRGYDLKPYLPALLSDLGPETKDIRYDWGRTLTELVEEQFLKPLHAFAQRHQSKFRIQGYGIPPATISSNAFTDISEGEGSHWRTVRAARWAASSNHLFDRNITTSETWTWLHSPSFRATPLDIKAEADLHFLQGINQLIGHGWPYTPDTVEYPGARFYAAAVFSDKNPWFIAMPDIARYLQRVSHMLRQGKPANDIALYLPNADVFSHFSAGRVHMIEALKARVGDEVIAQILDAGYNFDFFDDGTATRALQPGRYRLIVLPGVEAMPIETARQFATYVSNGGPLIATRTLPSTAPGLRTPPADKAAVAALTRSWKLVANESQLGATLRSLLRPDMQLATPNSAIGFVRRHTPQAEIYFIANSSNRPQPLTATFRIPNSLQPEIWDPLTAKTQPAQIVSANSETTTLSLHLEPYGSTLLVVSKQAPAKPAAKPEPVGQPIDISQNWQVQFPNRPAITMTALRSWTDELPTRYYSGAATYQRSVQIPASLRAAGITLKLDLGEAKPIPETKMRNGMRAFIDPPVREAAVIYINDQRAGALWCPPYHLDITPFLHPGENQIRIVAGNLAINHLAGAKLPNYRLLNLRYGVRFEPQDMDNLQPIPSGLLGPIRILAVK